MIKNRVLETNIANNGQVMTIIEYRKNDDIDIQFEDGTIVKNRSYDNFKKGEIKFPNIKNRIGETNIASNEQTMTIIDYRNNQDIDIQFEDGTIVKNKTYNSFKLENIKNPNCVISGISYNELFCLEQLKQFEFLKAEIGELNFPKLSKKELDLYNPKLKIGIEYDGGAYNKNKKYHTIEKDIEKDLLCEQAGITLYRIREPQLPKYNSSSIKYYLEDNRQGSQNLIDTISLIVKDINSRFNTNFKYNYKVEKFELRKKQNKISQKRIGRRIEEINKATNGQIMTIIKYRNTSDIDIQFEDGTIVKHKSYSNFKLGLIKNPNFYIQNRIGETNIANNRQVMTIVKYRGCNDIDVQFEDNTIVKHKSYQSFLKGKIKNPNYNNELMRMEL